MNQKRKETKKDLSIVGEKAQDVAKSPAVEASFAPMSYDAWWLQAQQKYNFKPELKESVKKHFEAKGFINDSRKFNDGLKDFGFLLT